MDMKSLHEKFRAALAGARVICDEVDKADRDFTAEERQKVAGYLDEAAGYKKQIQQAEGDEAIRKAILDMGGGIELSSKQTDNGSDEGHSAGKGQTIGEQFVQADAFQTWMKQFPGGRVPESAKGIMSPPIGFKSFLGRKTLITGADDTQAGAFVQTDYTGIYEPLGRMPLVLRSLISIRQTTSDLVEFVRQTTQVAEAATVAEANVTTYSGATGEVEGEKPEGAVEFEKVTATVKTIAVWIPATKRALSDASQLRGIIDQELRDDIEEELENQVLNGNGVGENFTGVLNTAGILTQLWNTDILTTTRQAKTTLKTTGRATPTAWLMNPSDWETIELLQDANNRYYWGGPLANGEPRLWGVPVVECESKAAGSAILADWRKAVMWDRERATLSISDSHADFFIRNMIAILAEMRAAFGLIRPSAFIEVDLTSGS